MKLLLQPFTFYVFQLAEFHIVSNDLFFFLQFFLGIQLILIHFALFLFELWLRSFSSKIYFPRLCQAVLAF